MSDIHVLPLEDIKDHIESDLCECNPKVIYIEGEKIIIHHSYDGREFLEDWEGEKGRLLQ